MSALGVVDTLAAAFAFGALTWFFFVQTMVLVKRLGRARFVPLQLGLVRPLFGSVSVASLVALGAGALGGASHEQLLSAGAALVTALFILLVVAPRAMRAGGESLREPMQGEADQSAARFTADGGGDATRVWHRVLGLLTVVLVAALGVHLAHPVLAGAGAPAHHHAEKWKANRETTEGVRAMQALVKRAQAHELTPADAATQLRAEWSGIFQRCTMTGAAHEALHGFLLPIDAQLKALATVEGGAADAVLRELAEHLEGYDGAFE